MIGTARQNSQIALYTLSLALATVGICCRLWARRITKTRWQLNDYLMIFAYLNVLGLVIAANLAVTIGEMGVHQSDILRHRLLEAMPFNFKMTIAIPFFLITSSIFVKMSITHFYVVLFPTTWLHNICKVQLILLTLSWFAGIIPCFVACRPLEFVWNRTLPGGGECIDVKKFWLAMSCIALVFDLSCVILPIPIFWSLKTSTAKKIKLTVLFGLGFFICALTVGRIYYDEKILFTDLAYTAAPAIMFTVPEPSLGVLAGCLPITVPLLTRASTTIKSIITSKFSTPANTHSQHHSRRPSLPSHKVKRFRKLQDQLYPPVSPVEMTSVVVSRCNGDDDEYDWVGGIEGRRGSTSAGVGRGMPARGMCPMQLRATEEMMRRVGCATNGITMLREVRVQDRGVGRSDGS